MAKFCKSCGHEIAEGKKFCGSCGAAIDDAPAANPNPQQPQPQQTHQNAFDNLKNMATNTSDYTGQYDPADIEKNKVISGLAYFIFFLPLIACPGSKFGRFHSNQALLLLILGIAGGIVNVILTAILLAISWRLVFLTTIIAFIIWIVIGVIGIIGLINGFSGKAKELPFIGKIHIIK